MSDKDLQRLNKFFSDFVRIKRHQQQEESRRWSHKPAGSHKVFDTPLLGIMIERISAALLVMQIWFECDSDGLIQPQEFKDQHETLMAAKYTYELVMICPASLFPLIANIIAIRY
eukprot:g74395.t1